MRFTQPGLMRAENPRVKLGIRSVLLASTLLLAAACSDERNSTTQEIVNAEAATRDKQLTILEERGFNGRHKLSNIKADSDVIAESHTSGSVEGEIDALFLLVVGGAEGDIKGNIQSASTTEKKRYVRLAWKSNSDPSITTMSEFPLDQIQVVEQEDLGSPELEFGMNPEALTYLGDPANGACYYDATTQDNKRPGYQPELCMTTTDSSNLNDILKVDGFLTYARLYLTPSQAAEFHEQVNNT